MARRRTIQRLETHTSLEVLRQQPSQKQPNHKSTFFRDATPATTFPRRCASTHHSSDMAPGNPWTLTTVFISPYARFPLPHSSATAYSAPQPARSVRLGAKIDFWGCGLWRRRCVEVKRISAGLGMVEVKGIPAGLAPTQPFDYHLSTISMLFR